MTKEDKELLLKDLCTRLNNKVKISTPKGINILTSIEICLNDIVICSCPYGHFLIEEIKPYLRPMTSMTEEVKEELSHLLPKDWSVEIDKLNNFYFDMTPSIFIEIDVFLNIIDWLNAHHFDYHGLISKGLAIEVTEKNNPYGE